MKPTYHVFLICYCNGQPVDFLLPAYSEEEFSTIKECAGTCFKVRDPQNAKILLACRAGQQLHTLTVNIESACKANSNISFSVVFNERDGTAYLPASTDDWHNDCYPLAPDFIAKARISS